jgi:hypothetical protein
LTTQTRSHRKNIIVISIVVVILLVSSVAILVDYNKTATTQRINLYLVAIINQDVLQGSSSRFKVLVDSIGKARNITLGCDVGSSGLNCTFDPPAGVLNFTSTLTVYVPDSTPTGNYTITVIASSDNQKTNASSVVSVLSANLKAGTVIVSGQANSAALFMPFPSSLISITFTDAQTDANTTYDFNFPPPPTLDPQKYSFGNYTVILMNQHTYNVTVSYYGNMDRFADYVGSFTVAVPAGQTAITKDF